MLSLFKKKKREQKETLYLGKSAEEVLNNSAFNQALEDLAGEYNRQLLNTKPVQKEEREELYRYIIALDQIESTLRGYLRCGTIEVNKVKSEDNQGDK